MSSLETAVRKAPDCPPWCTVNHSVALAQMEEREYGERVHGVCIAIVGEDSSVWVNRVDTIALGEPGPVTVWAETECAYLNTEQSIQYAKAVMRALDIAEPTGATA